MIYVIFGMIFIGIKEGGHTTLYVLVVVFGVSSLICLLHSPSQVITKFEYVSVVTSNLYFDNISYIGIIIMLTNL